MAEFPFQYAAKLVCTANIPGTSQTTTSFLPGSYQTAVNIHNPNNDLDVVAVYTAGGNEVTSIDVEYIRERIRT